MAGPAIDSSVHTLETSPLNETSISVSRHQDVEQEDAAFEEVPQYHIADTELLLSSKNRFIRKLHNYHAKTPLLSKLPFRAVAIITILLIANGASWTVAGLVLSKHTSLIPTAAIAWVLGLRHALDADHIACIDMMTRRLVANGQRPVTIGTFFSLGHSTIVIITSIVVAASSSAAAKHFDSISRVGGIIGSSVSAAFLLLLGAMNVYILTRLIKQLQQLLQTPPGQQPELHVLESGGGILFGLLKRLFRLIDRPWKLYPIGVLFGLGFDTSSEVALLGISALQASRGTSLWYILCFPLLFTAGMCLVDTIDGALMMSLYTSTAAARDPFLVTYYSLVLTGVTVLVALFIGTLQALELADAVISNPEGPFWHGVETLGNSYDIIGGAICGCFVFFGLLSILTYKSWRRWIEKRRARWLQPDFLDVVDGQRPNELAILA